MNNLGLSYRALLFKTPRTLFYIAFFKRLGKDEKRQHAHVAKRTSMAERNTSFPLKIPRLGII